MFTTFFVIITLLGYFFTYYLFKEVREKKVNLPYLIISFGIGLVLFISYSYIVDALYIFNFYTIYLPILTFALLNLLIFLKYNKNFRIKFSKNNITKIYQKFKDNLYSIIILLIVLILAWIFFYIFSLKNYGFVAGDPYLWCYNLFYLINNGNLDYYEIQGYTAGFIFTAAGSALLTNNFVLIFTHFKYLILYLFFINILSIFYISKRLFKKPIYIFLTLIIFMSFYRLMRRVIIPIPSVMADTMGFIFILTFLYNEDIKYFIIRGILLGGIILCHPLIGLFYVLVYLLYEIFFFIINFKKNKNKGYIPCDNIKLCIKSILIKNTILFTILTLTLIPFLFNQFLNNPFKGGVISNYLYFFNLNSFILLILQSNFFDFLKDFFEIWVLSGGKPYLRSLQELEFIGKIIVFYRQGISYGILFIIIGILFKYQSFLKDHQLKIKEQQLILFIKLTFICAFGYFLILGVFDILYIKQLTSIIKFMDNYKVRILEPIQGLWAILFTRGIIILKKPAKKIYLFIINKGKVLSENIKDFKAGKKEYTLFFISIIFIGGYLHLHNYFRISPINFYDNNHIEMVWYINEYFDTQSKDEIYKVLFSEYIPRIIFRLFSYRENLEIFIIKMNETTTYKDLNISTNGIDYIMIQKTIISEGLMENITDNFEKLHENEEFYFGKIK
ncbi:MAG: hypothetical protein ACTSPW_18950 [Promethearchaeota archaeon]